MSPPLSTGNATDSNDQELVVVKGATDNTSIGNVSDSMKVNVTNSFAAGTADKSTFTYGSSIANCIAAAYQDTSPDLTAGTQGAVRSTAKRGLHVNLRDSSGNELGTSSNPVVGYVAVVTSSAPSALSNGAFTDINTDPQGNIVQVTEDSTRARWGQAFFASSNVVTTGVSTEAAFFLLRNVNGNTKNIRIGRMVFCSPSSGNTIYRVYIDPTITLNGTALTVTGARQSGQNASQGTAFTTPTVSANGTRIKAVNLPTGTDFILDMDHGLWLEPNHSLLVTSTQSLIGGLSGVDAEWVEE